MLIWWKEYFQNWKINLFMIVQIVFVFALVNFQVSSIMEEYNKLVFAEETGSGLYIYQNCMGTLAKGCDWGNFQKAEQVLSAMPGMEAVGYQEQIMCDVEGYVNEEDPEYTEVIAYNMNPLMWKGLRYRLEEGRWFQEKDASDGELQVIIGGGLSKKYKEGDKLQIDFAGEEKKEAVVIGDMGAQCYIFDFGVWGIGQTFDNNANRAGDVIFMNDTALMEKMQEQSTYPLFSTLVKISEGTDLSPYERYGRLVSFDKMAENTQEQLKSFIGHCFSDNVIWLLVIVFGVVGTSYLTAKRRQYAWGVYSLCGVSGERLLRNLMLQNAATYLAGGLITIAVYPYMAQLLYYPEAFTIVNWGATGCLVCIIFVICYLCNRYIRRIEPKEILNQTRE